MISTETLSTYLEMTSIEEVWHFHLEMMRGYGFERLIYGHTHFLSGSFLGDPDDFIVLTNHPKEYFDRYLSERLYADARLTKWAIFHEGAHPWPSVNDPNLTDAERKVVEFNHKHGLKAGYAVALPSALSRSRGIMSLAAKPGTSQGECDAIWKTHSAEIIALTQLAHLKFMTLPYTPPGKALTKRQREVLEWVADGKTIQDTAVIMDLTPATVEKHLRLARAALRVETTAQAVMKAVFHNQIYVLDR